MKLRTFAVLSMVFGSCPVSWAQKSTAQAWDDEWHEITGQIQLGPSGGRDAAQALDAQALILPDDRDPADVVARRLGALLEYYRKTGLLPATKLDEFISLYASLAPQVKSVPVSDAGSRIRLFNSACSMRRTMMFANRNLDFDNLVCMLEQPGESRIVEQNTAAFPGHVAGGGPIIITGFKTSPSISKPLENVAVTSGPFQGNSINDRKFSGLDLSFNGRQLHFAATTNTDCFHLFKFDMTSGRLAQLTDGMHDDMDPCQLPSGRIVFSSTRRGGIGRCLLTPQSLTYTLHSMDEDGSDIIPISYHETNDWHPSVNHQGMLVYCRWDYFDRSWATAHHLFLCFPDGRDPRNWHGNYPLPYEVMPDGITPDQYGQLTGAVIEEGQTQGRFLKEDVDMDLRAIPNSQNYTATAVGHHQGFSGSLIMLDINTPDDGMMSQVKRITPLYHFPESEDWRGPTPKAYGTCWPLSEDLYLCNYYWGLYLLDRFGNRELIYDPGGGPHRVRDPFPLRSRTTPPVIDTHTFQGRRASLAEHKPATLGVLDCRITDSIPRPLPADVKIKWLRIIQIIPQLLTRIDTATTQYMGFADESTGRLPLGIVPVEEDGSVYCEAPVGKALYFQLLDENGMAIHSMRSVTYVHPGENLTCVGCHESKWKATPSVARPLAFKRPPSKIMPEVPGGAVPFNFHRLVEWPLFQTQCLPCHQQRKKGLQDMSYAAVAKFNLAFGYTGTPFNFPDRQAQAPHTRDQSLDRYQVGGSRTTPGRTGARASGIWLALSTLPAHKELMANLPKDDLRRLTLWLDMNSNELCWESDDLGVINAQRKGEVSWPGIDVTPWNPTGTEYLGSDDAAPSAVPAAHMTVRSFPVSHNELRWNPATDAESGIGCYRIYRNNELLCMVPDTQYLDRAIVAGTTYSYEISAVDRTGKEGAKTPAVLTAVARNPASVEPER
ncbi:MAG: hypothetical protein NTW21_30755 [Verrucomicrobia bacterium]|nr:hypothetical protein [Verrucomicrobiota bacterium]